MERRRSPLVCTILLICLIVTLAAPRLASAGFFDEDALKTTGIIVGITFGVSLVIVLIAVAVIEFRGGPDEDVWSKVPVNEEEVAAIRDLPRLLERSPEPPEPLPYFMLDRGAPDDRHLAWVPRVDGGRPDLHPRLASAAGLRLSCERPGRPSLMGTAGWELPRPPAHPVSGE